MYLPLLASAATQVRWGLLFILLTAIVTYTPWKKLEPKRARPETTADSAIEPPLGHFEPAEETPIEIMAEPELESESETIHADVVDVVESSRNETAAATTRIEADVIRIDIA